MQNSRWRACDDGGDCSSIDPTRERGHCSSARIAGGATGIATGRGSTTSGASVMKRG
jgi:hypothetical protein